MNGVATIGSSNVDVGTDPIFAAYQGTVSAVASLILAAGVDQVVTATTTTTTIVLMRRTLDSSIRRSTTQ